jgi:hypothetical protein
MPNSTARIAVLVAVLAPLTVPADVYRWVDESGVTVYSQWPAPSVGAVRVDTPKGPGEAERAAAEQRLQQQIEQLQDAADARSAAADERAQAEELARLRQDNCAKARSNLETLQNLGPRMVRKPDGSYVRMTQDEVAAEIRTAREQIDEYCQ